MEFNPDEYLASKGLSPEQKGSFDPDAYLKSKGASVSQPEIGMGKSAALGLMSGVPLAESAVAGLTSALGPTTYEEEHKNLEDLKNQAWEQHPVAYGSGKGAGLVGTAFLAPEGIPGAIGVGAASGLDTASNIEEMPKALAEGAALGGALGVAGEKILKPLINKGLPALAKGSLASLGSPTVEQVESRLANPSAIKEALGAPQAAEKLAQSLNKVSSETGALNEQARGLLSPDKAATGLNMIKNRLDGLINEYTENGVAKTGSAQKAIDTLQDQYQKMVQMADNNQLSETSLKNIIKGIQDAAKPSAFGNPDAASSQKALIKFSGKLNELLKSGNPEYAEAMVPVAEKTGLLSDASKKFGLESSFDPEKGITYNPTESTNTKMGNILKENKTESHDILNKLKDLTGYDFMANAKNAETKAAFETGKSGTGTSALGHSLGYILGHGTGLPFGGMGGALLGGIASKNVDGGQIAAKIIDSYAHAAEKYANSEIAPALQKYGPLLIQAAKKGGNQLAATHFVLATSNPEYQALADHLQNNH